MAKKKADDAPKGSPAWMATFSDLMNLLLCFFVLLFSMSSVDAAKFNEMAQSFASTFNVFKAGGAFFGDGNLVANGATQLNNLDEHKATMGEQSDSDVDSDQIYDNTEELVQYYKDKISELEGAIEDLEQKEQNEQAAKEEAAGVIYDEVTELAERYNLGSDLELSMDKAYNYKGVCVV